MSNARRIIAVVGVCIVLSSTACSTPEDRTSQSKKQQQAEAVRQGPAPSHHWVQDDQLLRTMKQLGASTAEQWPSTLPDDPEAAVTSEDRDQAFENGAKLAISLADAAERIPDSIALRSLSQADRDAFVATAQTLAAQSKQLGKAAKKHRVEEMQRLLDATRATCISCHTRFKDVSGELPPRA